MLQVLGKSIREYKKSSILTPLFVAGEVCLECILPFVMAKLVDDLAGSSVQPILRYGAVLLALAMCSLACGFLSGRFAATASAGFAKNLRKDLFAKVQDLSFQDVDKFSTSSLVTRMTTDVTNVQNAYQMIIRIAVRTPLMMIFSLIMSFSINARMSLIFLAMVPVLGVIIFGINAKVMPIFNRIFKKYDAMNESVEENVSGIRVVKAFVREDHERDKFHKASEEVRQDFTMAEKILAWNTPAMNACLYTAMLLVSYVGASLIIRTGGTGFTTGGLFSLITYGVQILSAIMMLSMIFVMVSMAQESALRISEVLVYEPTLVSPANADEVVPDGSIDFDHVSFCYAARSKNWALSDIDLHIPSGTSVGIIGGTGSSKTTLIQLIPRLYDATEGTVRVGGKDVKHYDLVALRDAVAVVLQKNVLFSGTILENMRWGNPNATQEEVERCCRLACADEFIQQMPDKYDTWIEQGGTNVSGGQKQRLCIARALLKKPKILILDDSTSAVDTRTDALIRKAFAEEIPDTTKIIIAQRITSVQDCDTILVMEGGRIAEQGNHESLLAKGGIYREIYDSQTGAGRKEAG
ncbi:MAG: ABC transporter ATP-binding protein/permease [Lachnospiraceae bacterium]|nr:ABC transporter ATP-binding protein/permease [Lachnospiraceae bacterium]MCI1397153.1 ABC transporter ATP-binding protein/permease [Lachnospiraceae bacterium]MCI1422791.1 ABC transporter ATP-binding protein/permease [Lachnospiraceae bacterium]MCI1451520.1 ABC transporter ATP-binding protein/permease [Lachnospiraceae bacterium]